MSNKAVLLRSVSTLATAAASTVLGAHGAQAQVVPAGTNGYYYSVTGGFALSKSEAFLTGLVDKVGYQSGAGYSSFSNASSYGWSSWTASGSSYASGFEDYKGIFGSVSFGKQVAPNWDIRGTLSVTTLSSSGSGYAYGRGSGSGYYNSSLGGTGYYESGYEYSSYGGGDAIGDMKIGITAADFEVGYTPSLGNNFNVRLFAGLRALKFETRFEGTASGSSNFSGSSYWSTGPSGPSGSSYVSSYNYFHLDGVYKTTFTGIGPRIGVQGSTRFEGTNFGLSGSLATSVLFGKQTVTRSGYYSSYYEYSGSSSTSGAFSDSGSSFTYSSSSYTQNKTVLDIEASVSGDYYLNDSTVLSIGVRGEKLMDVNGGSSNSVTDIDSLSTGAFVKLTGTF